MARDTGKPKKEPMSVRFLFVIAGVIWGLALGPDIGLVVAKFMGGLNWRVVSGTREWPEWADWVIAASGVVTGLAIFFTAFITGRNIGDRYEYSREKRLSTGTALPWAVIAVGVTVGGMTTLTIDTRQQAVVVYVQNQKNALNQLEALAENIQRFKSVRVEWPGNGEEGRASLSFRGKHQGNYLLTWEIWDASNNTAPVMEGEIGAILSPGEPNTSLPLSPQAIATAWRQRAGNVNEAEVSGDFTFRIRLIPELTRAEWTRLPRQEPDNMADGNSILIDKAVDTFPVNFRIRGGQIIWIAR
jgi:hypothetical protein